MYFRFILYCLSKKCCPFYKESYYIKWVTTSYSMSITYRIVRTMERERRENIDRKERKIKR